MHRAKSVFLILAGVTLAAGCVFVQPTTEGKKVRILTPGEVERCRSLGTLTSSVADYIGAIPRARDAVQDDVTLNAQNAAADMGGDTIVPASSMEGGKQIFNVYRCLAP